MQRTSKDVAEFLASLEGTQGDDMRRLDDLISEQMPGQSRFLYEGVFWSGSDQQIVGYGVLDYENRSREPVEWFLVGFAAQKDHISIYVNAVEDGQYLLRQYEGRLGKAKLGSANIAFKRVADLDLDNLLEMVSRASELSAT
jgi:hypothetical protein